MKIRCVHCGQGSVVGTGDLGGQQDCDHCGAFMEIPEHALAEEVPIDCTYCRSPNIVGVDAMSLHRKCTKCGATFRPREWEWVRMACSVCKREGLVAEAATGRTVLCALCGAHVKIAPPEPAHSSFSHMVFKADLVLCCLLLPVLLVAFVVLAPKIPEAESIQLAFHIEFGSRFIVFLIGVWANSALLKRKNTGYMLGVTLLAAWGFSVVLGFAGVILQHATLPEHQSGLFLVGGIAALSVRVGMWVVYAYSLRIARPSLQPLDSDRIDP